MINLLLEFKKWFEASYDYYAKSRSSHFNAIRETLKDYDDINKKIQKNVEAYLEEISQNKINPNAKNILDNYNFLNKILSFISQKTRGGRDFLDFQRITVDEMVNNVFAIAADMAKQYKVFVEFIRLSRSRNFEDILDDSVSDFLINPNNKIELYQPLFKEFFKKEDRAIEKSALSGDKGNGKELDFEDPYKQEVEDDIEKARNARLFKVFEEQKQFQELYLQLEPISLKSFFDGKFKEFLSKGCFKIDDMLAFVPYIGKSSIPQEYSKFKNCFYVKFMSDILDDILNKRESNLQHLANKFLDDLKSSYQNLNPQEIDVIQSVVLNFYSKNTYNFYSKLLKVLIAAKAAEQIKLENENLKDFIPLCKQLSIYIKEKFSGREMSDLSNILSINVYQEIAFEILGKRLSQICKISEEEFDEEE